MFNEGHNAALMTGLERAYELRIAELERRLTEMEAMYDKVAADLIEALDVASAYRATASTLHQEIERRNGVERRENRGIYLESQDHEQRPARTHRIRGQAQVMATLRIFVWTLFFATIGFILFAPMSVAVRVVGLILGSIGVVILALAEIDEHLSTRRGWYKK